MTRKGTFPRFDRMGEAALLVTFGQGISEAANDHALALDRSLRAEPLPGIDDTVPAYASLLVIFRPEVLSGQDLETILRERLDGLSHGPSSPRTVDVPVTYGGENGPDLAALAELHGLSEEDVVRLHTGRPYRVYFIGFMPGFPYMGRVARRLATPRRATPRVRVAPGSVGIAGSQTGIYPFASPGGWQIIGRTGLTLWDARHKSPSLLLPGDIVQFVSGDQDLGADQVTAAPPRIENPVFEIVEIAGISMIQDFGRPGYSNVGLSRGGVFDVNAAARANALIVNRPDAPLLELAWSGPTMIALQNVTIAIDGADLGCRVDGASVPTGMAWFVRRGSTIRFSQSSPSRSGARAYMALSGGIFAAQVLGSASTYLPGGFGGLGGRAVRAGDILGCGPVDGNAPAVAGRFWLGRTQPRGTKLKVLRYTRYSGAGSADRRLQATFAGTHWKVGEASDRMGIRLDPLGEEIKPIASREVVSFGVVRGAIQLPPSGTPLVLGPDHQTTGGYPVLGIVIEADMAVLAQLRAGDTLSFVEVTLEQALVERTQARRDLMEGIAALEERR